MTSAVAWIPAEGLNKNISERSDTKHLFSAAAVLLLGLQLLIRDADRNLFHDHHLSQTTAFCSEKEESGTLRFHPELKF